MDGYLTLTLWRDTVAVVSEDFTKRVAAEVRAEQHRLDLTQEQLAAKAGMSQSTLSRRLSGELPFDTDELVHVAAALDTSAIEILQAAEDRLTSKNGAPGVSAH
jgi:transcriptional regulator with XRE-family HTH domain